MSQETEPSFDLSIDGASIASKVEIEPDQSEGLSNDRCKIHSECAVEILVPGDVPCSENTSSDTIVGIALEIGVSAVHALLLTLDSVSTFSPMPAESVRPNTPAETATLTTTVPRETDIADYLLENLGSTVENFCETITSEPIQKQKPKRKSRSALVNVKKLLEEVNGKSFDAVEIAIDFEPQTVGYLNYIDSSKSGKYRTLGALEESKISYTAMMSTVHTYIGKRYNTENISAIKRSAGCLIFPKYVNGEKISILDVWEKSKIGETIVHVKIRDSDFEKGTVEYDDFWRTTLLCRRD